MALIGYARVSTDEQTTAPQMEPLRAAGCTVILEEHASGGDRSRPVLHKAIERCRKGDVLVVVRLDRLARSLAHLLQVIERLEARGAGFRSLGDPIDTTSPQGRFALQVLGAAAELEKALIRERTIQGVRAAKAAGKRPGNHGVMAGDPQALRTVAAARDEARTRKVLAVAEPVIAAIRQLRPDHPWDTVVRVLNKEGAARPATRSKMGRGGEPTPWTRNALIRVARRLASDGFIPAVALGPAPKKRDSDDLLLLISGIVAGMQRRGETPTLAAIGKGLEDLRQRTPRGGTRWSRSSVQNLLERAKQQGLVADTTAT